MESLVDDLKEKSDYWKNKFNKVIEYIRDKVQNIFGDRDSEVYEKMADDLYINNVIDRGTTLYPVYGGYTKKERMEIKTAVSKKQAEKTKEEILKIDPNCFLTLTNSILDSTGLEDSTFFFIKE